jgi:hypothetical protein
MHPHPRSTTACGVPLLTLLVTGLLILALIAVVFVAASIIDADSFEFTTTIWKLVAFSIRIRSSPNRELEDSGSDPSDPKNQT